MANLRRIFLSDRTALSAADQLMKKLASGGIRTSIISAESTRTARRLSPSAAAMAIPCAALPSIRSIRAKGFSLPCSRI